MDQRLAGLKDMSMSFTGTFDEGKSGITFPLMLPVTRLIYGEREYTPAQFMDYCRNEIFRRGSRPHLRTRSPRWRAGTRRTKKLARASR